jgi:peptidoglycan hydrolase-like protein with peptidoglycan-binding domain
MPFIRVPLLGSLVLTLAALMVTPATAAVQGVPAPERPANRLVQVEVPVDEMPPEMRKAYIRGIQEELAAHGYKPGPADGVMGPRTRGAIRKYQRDAGLPVTGVATKEILDHLKFVQPKVFAKPEPKPSGLVYDVQVKLRERGYYHGPLDGVAGPASREAARAFRYDAGLPVSGAIDEDLLARLSATEGPMAGVTEIEEPFTQPESADWPPEPADEAVETWTEPEPLQPLVAVPPPPEAD